MTTFKKFISILAVLALSACGRGGGNSGTCPFGCEAPPPGTNNTVADLDVKLSAPTITNTISSVVTATVTALNADRNAVPNVAVTLSTDSGLITVGSTEGSVTDSTGKLLATVSLGSNLTAPRVITITAKSGSITRTTTLQVVTSTTTAVPASVEVIASATTVGTGGDTVSLRAFVKDANNNALVLTPVSFTTSTGTLTSVGALTDSTGTATATFSAGADKSNRTATITVSAGTITGQLSLPITGTKLTLSGPSSMIVGSSGSFDVVLTDSKSNVVANAPITATSSLGNTVTASGSASTNSNGLVRFTYNATKSGTDTLVFTGAGATVSPSPALEISSEDFAFISPAPSTTVPVGLAQALQVRLRSGGVAQAGRTVNFTATGGTLSASSAITDASGVASVSLTSQAAGPVTVQAAVANSATSTSLPLNIVATSPTKLVLQVSPTAIAPNTSPTSANQAQVVAKVTDANANPVQGVTVNFTRDEDPSGGNLLQASATTDANGQATVAYRSGSESTANNGVKLSGTVASAPTVTGSARLTVNQTALFIAIGTGNEIANIDSQTYRKDWTVYVTDSNGVPVNGVTLTIKVIPTFYLTGSMVYNDAESRWVYNQFSGAVIRSCRNEDANTNGVLDPGEDDNGDGVLWPGNVIAVSPGTVQTTNGRATISLTYAESYAPWVQVRLTASATVTGTESRTDAEFIVGGSATDFGVKTNPPAGVISPFGTAPRPGAVCTQILP